MSNATKFLGAILLLLIAVWGGMNWVTSPDREAELRKNGWDFSPSAIDRITVEHPAFDRPVDLRMNEQKSLWKVHSEGEVYSPDRELLEKLKSALDNFQIKRHVTGSESQHSGYQVDQTGTRITWYDGDDVVDGLILGRFHFGGDGNVKSYIRRPNENDVYLTGPELHQAVQQAPEEWREAQ